MALRKSSNVDLSETVKLALEASVRYPWVGPYTAYSEADRAKLQSELQTAFPFVNVSRATLGGENKASLLATVSIDKREKWSNGILENSRYAKFHVSNGKVECISGGRVGQGWAKMRLSVVRDVTHAATKIIAWATGLSTSVSEAITGTGPICVMCSDDAKSIGGIGTCKATDEPHCRGCCNSLCAKYGLSGDGNHTWMLAWKYKKSLNESDFPGLGLLGAVGELATYELPSAGELVKLLLKYPKWLAVNAVKDFKDWRNDPMVDIDYLGSQSLGNHLDADFYRHRSRRGATIDRVVATPRGYGKPNSRNVNNLRTVCLYQNWEKWKKKNLNVGKV